MGRDNEFLEAARNGNITIVEKFLLQKLKKSGPLASLRRGPGVNVQDSCGYSALHHAALNGHVDIVKLLLVHDASTNLPDSRGSSPLHLAAWAGHQEIVKIFLIHSYNPANANLQTIEKETPLHCAAQYGHTGVLTTLLAHGGNPNMTNCRNETPLDLAAQYGRLQAVQLLIRVHPELLLPFKNPLNILEMNNENSSFGINAKSIGGGGCVSMNSNSNCGISRNSRCNSRSSHASSFSIETTSTKPATTTGNYSKNSNNQFANDITYAHTHTPLHLASRNGHKNVVELLLAAGVDVNVLTPSGTALHEAALCGKDNVVRTLLDSGADLDATDFEGRTSLDILEEFPPHVTRGIVSVINNYRKSLIYDSESDDVHKYNQKSNNFNSNRSYMTTPMSLGSSYETNRVSPIQNYSSSHYDITTSPSSSVGSLGPTSPSPKYLASNDDIPPEFYNSNKTITSHINDKIIQGIGIKHSSRKPTAPKKPPRRNLSVSPTRLLPFTNNISNQYITISINGNSYGGSSNNGGHNNNIISSTQLLSPCHNNMYNISSFKGKPSSIIQQNQTKKNNGKDKFRSYSADQCINNMSSTANYMGIFELNLQNQTTLNLNNKFNSNTALRSYNPNRKLKRNRDSFERFNIDFNKDKAYYEALKNYPQSPTNYQQPPTPEHPPPTPSQAEIFIYERINPLNKEYKRRSALENSLTIESGTSTSQDGLCSLFRASSGSISSSISLSDRSISTDCVEEYVEDMPFAGLFKGSIMNLDNSYLYYSTYPNNHRNYSTDEVSTILCRFSDIIDTCSESNYVVDDGAIDNEDINNIHNHDNNITYNVINNDENQSYSYFTNNNNNNDSNIIMINNNYNDINNDGDININKKPFKQLNNTNDDGEKMLNSITIKDEETWSKIAEIMETFGRDQRDIPNNDRTNSINIINKTNNIDDIKINDCNNIKIQSDKRKIINNSLTMMMSMGCEINQLHNILANWNLLNLENKFIENGYDNTEFMNGVVDANDLLLMDIPVTEHKLILEMIKTLPKTEPLPVLYTNSNNNTMLTVDQWLENIDLSVYKEDFRKHLYTNMEMICQVWEVELQTVLEIKKIGHRRRILYSVSSNRKPPPPKRSTTTTNELSCDLNNIKAQNNIIKNRKLDDSDNNKLIQNIEENIFTTTVTATTTVTTISTSIKSTTRINNITNATIATTINTKTPITTTTTTTTTTATTTTTTTTNFNKMIPSLIVGNNQPIIRHGNRKNRPAPKPPIKTSPLLEIRAPSELLLGLPSNLRTQWRHAASALVCNSVKYDVYYLGSTIVKELRGTESTRKSIQKLKRDDRILSAFSLSSSSARNRNLKQRQIQSQLQSELQQQNLKTHQENEDELSIIESNNSIEKNQNQQQQPDNKKRPVRLQISHRGVEFIDIEIEKLICIHEIRNINCACQDADDLSHFAYITKDSDNQTYYCHVFNVNSMDLATEIILTLGQAFEVAYQLALQGKINSVQNLKSLNRNHNSQEHQNKQQQQINEKEKQQQQPQQLQHKVEIKEQEK